jgi:hypothetical protein
MVSDNRGEFDRMVARHKLEIERLRIEMEAARQEFQNVLQLGATR